jgi:hypothetical protein
MTKQALEFRTTMNRLAHVCGVLSCRAPARSKQEKFYAQAEIACRQARLVADILYPFIGTKSSALDTIKLNEETSIEVEIEDGI